MGMTKKQVTLWVDGRLGELVEELDARGMKVSPSLTLVLERYVEAFATVLDAIGAIQNLHKENVSEGR